jgi:hypothetical protein
MPLALIAHFQSLTPVLFAIATAGIVSAASYTLLKIKSDK